MGELHGHSKMSSIEGYNCTASQESKEGVLFEKRFIFGEQLRGHPQHELADKLEGLAVSPKPIVYAQ